MKKINEALSQTRKDLFKQETLVDNKKLLKGTRWFLLNTSENFSEKGKQRLEKAFEINKPLLQIYYLKEELSLLWKQLDKKAANDFFDSWCEQAIETKLSPVMKYAKGLSIWNS